MLGIVRLHSPLVLRVQRGIPRGDAEVRSPLEDDQRGGLPGDEGDGLDGGRARADHADALAGEVDALVRPVPGVIPPAREGLESLERGHLRGGQAARRHDAELRRDAVAAVRLNRPAVRRFVEDRRGHSRRELHVPAQVEPVGDVIDVPQDLRLGGVPLGPRPFLLELLRERVRVVHALDIAAGTRVTVPVPRAPDAAARLVHPRREPDLAQAVEHVQPGQASPDDDRVEGAARLSIGVHRLSLQVRVGRHAVPPRRKVLVMGEGATRQL